MWLILGFCVALSALLWVLSRDSKRANDSLDGVQRNPGEPFTATATFHGDNWHLAVDAPRKKIALIRLHTTSVRPPHLSSNDMTFVLPLASVAAVQFDSASEQDRSRSKGARTFHIRFTDWPDPRWDPVVWDVVMARDASLLQAWMATHMGIEPK